MDRSKACGELMHKRCDGRLENGKRCTCFCHGQPRWVFPAALGIAALLGTVFAAIGWVLRGWLR